MVEELYDWMHYRILKYLVSLRQTEKLVRVIMELGKVFLCLVYLTTNQSIIIDEQKKLIAICNQTFNKKNYFRQQLIPVSCLYLKVI